MCSAFNSNCGKPGDYRMSMEEPLNQSSSILHITKGSIAIPEYLDPYARMVLEFPFWVTTFRMIEGFSFSFPDRFRHTRGSSQ